MEATKAGKLVSHSVVMTELLLAATWDSQRAAMKAQHWAEWMGLMRVDSRVAHLADLMAGHWEWSLVAKKEWYLADGMAFRKVVWKVLPRAVSKGATLADNWALNLAAMREIQKVGSMAAPRANCLAVWKAPKTVASTGRLWAVMTVALMG